MTAPPPPPPAALTVRPRSVPTSPTLPSRRRLLPVLAMVVVAAVGVAAGAWAGDTLRRNQRDEGTSRFAAVAEFATVPAMAVAGNGDIYVVEDVDDVQTVWHRRAGSDGAESLPLSANDTSDGAIGLAVGTDGTVYFTTRDGDRILKLPAREAVAEELVFSGVVPNDVAVGPDGAVFVADARGGVFRLGPGDPEPTRLPFPDFYGVSSVAVDETGDVYAVEFFSDSEEPDRLWKMYSDTTSGASATILTPGVGRISDIVVTSDARIHVLGESTLLEVTDEFTERIEVPLGGGSSPALGIDDQESLYLANHGESGTARILRIPSDAERVVTPARSGEDATANELVDGSGDAVANSYGGIVYGPADISAVRIGRSGTDLVIDVEPADGVDSSAVLLSIDIDVAPTGSTNDGCDLPGTDFAVNVTAPTGYLLAAPPNCDGRFDKVDDLEVSETGRQLSVTVPMRLLGISEGSEVTVQATASTRIDDSSTTTIQDMAPDDGRGFVAVVP